MATQDLATTTPVSPTTGNTLQSVTALARFEFEPGRGNEGTKVVMVEWQDEDTTRDKTGSWLVSWTGKKAVFPADDDSNEGIHRVYFLLPPGSIIPPNITIAYHPPKSEPPKDEQTQLYMTVNPLPAIFTPELGATAKASGKKGVLHTIWAKKRLQALDKEIRREEEHNLEGIALEMALAEKSWIENSFGLLSTRPSVSAQHDSSAISSGSSSHGSSTQGLGLQNSRPPPGRRLSEKLRGLSLNTSEKDLSASKVNTITREANPLSPEASDMAESSFSAFHSIPAGATPLSPAIPPPPAPTPVLATASLPIPVLAPTRKIVAQLPPDFIRQQQMQAPSASLDFLSQPRTEQIQSATPPPPLQPLTQTLQKEQQHQSQLQSQQSPMLQPSMQQPTQPPTPPADSQESEEDLFAIALSPTSPDMPKSPFSFSSEDIGAFNKVKGF